MFKWLAQTIGLELSVVLKQKYTVFVNLKYNVLKFKRKL